MSTPMTTEQDNFQSRLPDPTQFFPELAQIAGDMLKATLNGSIPQTTVNLVQLRAGQIVGSTYHTVRQTGLLRKAGETEERITAVAAARRAARAPARRPQPTRRGPPAARAPPDQAGTPAC
jgi:alkylhydroperoxidase family enzyme